MKVELSPTLRPRRGEVVKLGNVYQHAHGRPFYKVVVGLVERAGNRPWNNVVMIHVNAMGQVVGCSSAPQDYLKNHNDLMGYVKNMPSLKVEWFK